MAEVPLAVKRMNRTQDTGTLKAFCDVSIGGAFVVKGIRVVEGKNGVFVSMPREQGKDGNWYATVIPVSPEIKQQLSELVLAAYDKGELEEEAAAQEL